MLLSCNVGCEGVVEVSRDVKHTLVNEIRKEECNLEVRTAGYSTENKSTIIVWR